MTNAKLDMHDELVRITDWLSETEMPVALVLTETLEPALGKEAEIFPPTFAKDGNPKYLYNIDELRTDIAPSAAKDGEIVNTCLIDSIGSQANRMETCFTKPPLSRLVPQITVVANDQKANLLDVGHRIADAAVRFSELEAQAHGAIVKLEKEKNALDLAKLAPTSLVFGFWDSRDTQAKYGRILSSVIRATNVSYLTRSATFNSVFKPDKVFSETEFEEIKKYPTEKKGENIFSEIGLDNALATGTHGGVRVFGAITRRTQINLVGVRALAVTNESGEINEAETMNLRRYLLGLALVAARCQQSYNLREGCLLVKASEKSSVVYSDGNNENFHWNLSNTFDFARLAAENFGVGENKPNVQFAFSITKSKLDTVKTQSAKKNKKSKNTEKDNATDNQP